MGYLIAILILILISSFISATETAYSSLNRIKLQTLQEKEDKYSKKISLAIKLVDNYDKLISTILIINNVANILMTSLSAAFFIGLDKVNGATISTIIMTLVVLIVCEISPKSLAKDCPEKFAIFSAPIMNIITIILSPVNYLFSLWKKFLSNVFKLEESSKSSPEELIMMVEKVEKDGNFDNEESEIIKNAIDFPERKAEDIITHRLDVVAASINSSKEEIADMFTKTQFSRILIYNESIDNIVGVIHIKDFYSGTGITKQEIKKIMSKPIFITKSEKIGDVLKRLQKNKSQIAIVIDDYGGTQGIVTMEDILEELVGEIWDEHDDVIEFIKKINENTYEVNCSMDFEDFCEFFNIDCNSNNNLINSWIFEQIDKIPEENDSFIFNNLKISFSKIENRRIEKIKVQINNEICKTS